MPIEDGNFRLALEYRPVGRFKRDPGVVIEKRDLKHSVALQNAAALLTQIDRANGVIAGSSGRPTQRTTPGSWLRFPQNRLRSFRGPISESRLSLHRLNAHAGDRR